MDNISFNSGRFVVFSILYSGLLLLTGCDIDESSDNEIGYIKFYNASHNSPNMYLTIDEDLSNENSDETEVTYTAGSYGSALRIQELPTQQYDFQLTWRDTNESSGDQSQVVVESQLTIEPNEIDFLVMYGDIQSPHMANYDIKIEDQDDADSDIFNLRLLNVSNGEQTLDVYISKSNETFNEALLIGTVTHLELTQNIQLDQDDYIFYLTLPGHNEVLFESTVVEYRYTNQYVVVIRNDSILGNRDFIIDNVGTTSKSSHQDSNAMSYFKVYNGVQQSDLNPDYTGEMNVIFDSLGDESIAPINNLSSGAISSLRTLENGDFTIDITDSTSGEYLLNRQLISLEANTHKTLFFYAVEVAVDEDGDGNVDEDGDGKVDEKELQIRSLLTGNSTRERIYDHEIKLLNLAHSDDFERVTFYFVESDETISSTSNVKRTKLGNTAIIDLTNNTYDVFAITEVSGREILLDSMILTLNEETHELFMLLEPDELTPSGFKIRVINQISNQ